MAIETDTTVYTGFNNPANWVGWTCKVRVNAVDLGDQLIDEQPVIVEAERGGARIAEFTVKLTGTVNPNDWTGKSVTIHYVTAAAAEWLLFTGVIVNPVLNVQNMTLRCQCSDDLQRVVDGMSNAAIKAEVGGYWHESSFDETAVGWSYLQDLASTVPYSVELNKSGALKVRNWQVIATPNYTFNEDFIFEDNLAVELVQRSTLVNKIELTFKMRFERYYHREETMSWSWPLTFCETLPGVNYGRFPSKGMITDAINNADWRFLSATYTLLFPTQLTTCDAGPFAWTNNNALLAKDADKWVMGFVADAAFRWQQSVTDKFVVTIAAPDSIAAYGELKQTIETAHEYEGSITDFTAADADYSAAPVGFVWDTSANQFKDDIDATDLAEALNCAIAVAVEKINKSHRSNRVRFSVPMVQHLDLIHTVAVSDGSITAKGVVEKLRYELDLKTAAARIAVDLALSSGQSGSEIVTQSWTAPTHSATTGSSATTSNTVPTWRGRSFAAVDDDGSLWGWFVNRTTPELIASSPPDPIYTYTERLEMKFDAIPSAKTQNREDTFTASIDIDVPAHPLVIVA